MDCLLLGWRIDSVHWLFLAYLCWKAERLKAISAALSVKIAATYSRAHHLQTTLPLIFFLNFSKSSLSLPHLPIASFPPFIRRSLLPNSYRSLPSRFPPARMPQQLGKQRQ